MLADRVQVVGLGFPELYLSQGVWVVAVLECRLRVLLQHVINLLGQSNYGA